MNRITRWQAAQTVTRYGAAETGFAWLLVLAVVAVLAVVLLGGRFVVNEVPRSVNADADPMNTE